MRCHFIFRLTSLLLFKEVLEELSIPAVYLQQDETAIAITLLQLSVQNEQDLNRVSIDVREKSTIENVINDLEQSTTVTLHSSATR